MQPGSVVHTDGWLGYLPLEEKGYLHRVTFLRGKRESASELMPRVHRVVSLLKRWLRLPGVPLKSSDPPVTHFTTLSYVSQPA